MLNNTRFNLKIRKKYKLRTRVKNNFSYKENEMALNKKAFEVLRK